MSRTPRERRTPLPPDQAVRPLVERGLASTTVRPRAIRGRGRGRAPGRIPIVVDSDTSSDEENSSQICEDNETNAPAHTQLSLGSIAPGTSASTPRVLNDFPMGLRSDNEEDIFYGDVDPPPQTREAFQALLREALELGFRFKAPEKDEGLPPAEDTEQSLTSSRSPSPASRPGTPPMSLDGPQLDEWMNAVLVVFLRARRGLYKHAVLRSFLPSSVLGAYECLVKSGDVAVAKIIGILRTWDDDDVMLATSRKPIQMNETRTYEGIRTGYTELGRLSELDRSVQFEEVLECEQQREVAELYTVPQNVPIFVLYLWSDESEEELPLFHVPMAVPDATSKAATLIDPLYKVLFEDLVLHTPLAHSTFTGIVFVRIVLKVCQQLGINCARRVGLMEAAGPHHLSATDVVSSFRRDEHKLYLQPKTFSNHRGLYFRIEQLYDTLASVYPNSSLIPDNLTDEKLMVKFTKDLLKTPLTEMRELSPRIYGQMTDFVDRLKSLERRYGLAKKDNHKERSGRASTSRRKEREAEESDSVDEIMV